jgi:hypothetical protein
MGWGSIDFGFLAPVFATFNGMVIAELTWAKGAGGPSAEDMARAALIGWHDFWQKERE